MKLQYVLEFVYICYSLAGIHVESLITTRTVPNTVAERVSCGNM